jgi:hypothetical protein
MPMDLLDRYLQAVKFWLPSGQKDDIIAELSEELQSQIAESETALGRRMTPAELEALLKQMGRPVVVANRYLPQRYLIGPLLFPVYAFVLKIVAICYLVPWILVWIGLMLFDPSYRAAHIGVGWTAALGEAWSGFWLAAVIAVGTVTIVFAVLERAQTGVFENWDPVKLPAVRDPRRIPRLTSTLELVANIVFASWWVTSTWSPAILNRPHVQITFAPVWTTYFWGFLLLAVTNVGVAAINLLRPFWTRARASVRAATNLVGSALFAALFGSNIVSSIAVAGVPAAKTFEIATTINRVLWHAMPVAIGVGVVVLATDVYRIVRVGHTPYKPENGLHGAPTRVA